MFKLIIELGSLLASSIYFVLILVFCLFFLSPFPLSSVSFSSFIFVRLLLILSLVCVRSPVHNVMSLLTSIQSLLTDPNVASPANPEAANLYSGDKKEYRKRVRACVAKCTM